MKRTSSETLAVSFPPFFFFCLFLSPYNLNPSSSSFFLSFFFLLSFFFSAMFLDLGFILQPIFTTMLM